VSNLGNEIFERTD